MHQAAAVRRHPVVGGALLLLALVVRDTVLPGADEPTGELP